MKFFTFHFLMEARVAQFGAWHTRSNTDLIKIKLLPEILYICNVLAIYKANQKQSKITHLNSVPHLRGLLTLK
jgi:hypothetical protein